VNSDVNGPNRLGLSTVTFYMSLGDPAIRDLMVWAFENPAPTDFRVMSVYSLVWTQPPAKTIELYSAALLTEREPTMQRAMVENLAFLRDPKAMKVLTDTFLDPTRDPALRALAAAQIATVEDPGIEIALQNAARGDPDERVREASAIALVIRNPPVSGYMVTGTLPDSQASAAGMKSGDILVSYGGRPVRTLDDLRAAAGSTAGEQKVPVVVVRDGREVTIDLRPGRMGIYGREVNAAADR
jgi:membrane-associated protease RseP (regulator of RpoE activity)